ncbi:MAG: UbiD family decarboxylase domain-containing protein, partial [Burkholderiales bacterium]
MWQLAAEARHPVVVFERVGGLGVKVVTNIFGSRVRVARLLGTDPLRLHETYQARARQLVAPRVVSSGPVLDSVQQSDIDLGTLPLMRHFETDRAPYITNGIVAAEHPDTGAGNLSYHRAMLHSKTELATSLHSRGHL